MYRRAGPRHTCIASYTSAVELCDRVTASNYGEILERNLQQREQALYK